MSSEVYQTCFKKRKLYNGNIKRNNEFTEVFYLIIVERGGMYHHQRNTYAQ